MVKSFTVTLDTNIFPIDDLLVLMRQKSINYKRVSVTDREMANCRILDCLDNESKINETGIWNESLWGEFKWGPVIDETAVVGESKIDLCVVGKNSEIDVFETLLKIISNNTFPRNDKREHLTPGERRQLRDAMILTAHIRDKRDLFITNDLKGFVSNGKRDYIQETFKTKIMTREEFKSYLEQAIL